jgi:uncharacterized membrane protein
MFAGFGAGTLFEIPEEKRKKIFLKLGFGALGLFLVIRFINVYGDPSPWVKQKNAFFSLLSFINITKYPPSLIFCLVTLGVLFIILFFATGMKGRIMNMAEVYGKVPLFYFLVHWYILHPLLYIMVFMQGFKFADLSFGFNMGRPPSGSGLSLWAVYLIWMMVVAVLYPLCKWYGDYKKTHPEKAWLRYI